ncbi:MAG: 1-hydroxycarotenoid 3,4-desaturase CrtD [Pseudomonadota bacterium]
MARHPLAATPLARGPHGPIPALPSRHGGAAWTRALVDALHPAPRGRAPRPRRDRVVVIGAGMGGLAAALRLAADGCDVTVLERAAHLGGKARTIEVGGRAVDAGPTVFTMRWVFDDLFAAAGTALDDHLALMPATVLARHAWPDGTRFDLFADLERTADGIHAFAGAAEAERYRAFARQTERAYAVFRESFIEGARPGPLDVVARIGLRGLPALIAARPSANMFRAIADTLQDDRLRQLFARYATYCGSSPYRAPATLMLIAHVERLGVWQIAGGMQALAGALAGRIEAAGGRIRTGATVERIETEGGRVSAVRLAGGERIGCEAVVFNGDAGALGAGLLGAEAARAVRPVAPARRSLSAMVWSVNAPATGFPLSHHTVFFGPEYRAEFERMGAGHLPRDPTTYVCALDRPAEEAVEGGPGPERCHVQVNAPAIGDLRALSAAEIETCRRETEALMARAGLALSLAPETSRLTTPREFARLFPGTGGALYGAATHGPVASFLRPAARTRVPGLVLAGGSAHPGAGVPMAALSGAQAATAVTAHLRALP